MYHHWLNYDLPMTKPLLAILLLLPLVVYGEHHAGVEGVDLVDGNPQKAESADAISRALDELGLSIAGVKLGISFEQAEKEIKDFRDKDSYLNRPSLEKTCQNQDSIRWCTYHEFKYRGFNSPLTIALHNNLVIAIRYKTSGTGRSFVRQFARKLEARVDPTLSETAKMIWQQGAVSLSTDWDKGELIYLDTAKFSKAQQ